MDTGTDAPPEVVPPSPASDSHVSPPAGSSPMQTPADHPTPEVGPPVQIVDADGTPANEEANHADTLAQLASEAEYEEPEDTFVSLEDAAAKHEAVSE